LADNGSATLFLGDRLLVTPLGTPDPQRDDSWYDMWKDPSAQDGGSWAKTAFRPGRLYALHFHAQRTDATVSPPDTDANEGDTDDGDADGAPVSPKDTAAEAVSLADVNIHVYMPGTAKVQRLAVEPIGSGDSVADGRSLKKSLARGPATGDPPASGSANGGGIFGGPS